MAMKTFVVLILLSRCTLYATGVEEDIFANPQLHVVRVKIVKNENAGSSYYVATGEVEEVLKGRADFMGKSLDIANSDKPFLGSSVQFVSQPLLEKGQVCMLYVVERGGVFWGSGGLSPGDMMFPLIEGVHPEYDVMLQWFRERRDHPERLTPVPIAAKQQAPQIQAPPVPEVPVITPPAVKPPKVAQPATKLDDQGSSEDGGAWWWMVGALVALGALVLGWLRRHPAKRVGT
ncbi:MAG: hypothetical protein JNN17_23230 [Verrucomicrobiaceae bacterium]|nr:hypothetical protein [Verrucomicrobiaceae bacterium]